MALAGTAAITELWAKCKAWFGRKLSASTTSTTVSIQLQNNAGDSLGNAATISAATAQNAGIMTADMYSQISGLISTGGEVNQNAFSNVKVGSTTIAADQKTDTLELVAGDNVTLTPDATNDKVTIAATDTTYTPSSSNPAMDGTAAAGTSTDYARGDHVHPSDTSRAPTSHASSSTTYGKGTNSNYGHVKLSDATDGTAAASSGGTAATPKAVSDALAAAKTYADGLQTGAAMFQGTVAANTTISGSSYKKGWYWVVSTAGTYVGQSCEVGDMVFAIADKSASYSASDFSVIQNNIIEMTIAEIDAICV